MAKKAKKRPCKKAKARLVGAAPRMKNGKKLTRKQRSVINKAAHRATKKRAKK